LTSRASGICERQGEHYRTRPDDVFPKGFHLTYTASAPLALQVNYFFITWGVPVPPLLEKLYHRCSMALDG
jgi:hypothetical protein